MLALFIKVVKTPLRCHQDIKALKTLRGNFNNRDSENLRRLKDGVDKWLRQP